MCAAVVKGRVAPAAARWSAFGPTQVNAASHRPPFAASNAGPRIRLSTLGTRLFLHPAGQPTGWRAFLNDTDRASPGCDFAGTKEAPAQVSRSQMRRYRLFSLLQAVPYPLGLHIFAEYAWQKWYSQADVFLRRHPKARIKCLGAGGAAARRHSSGATHAEKERHVADVAAFDARELGGRYRALRERVPCRSRYLPNQ